MLYYCLGTAYTCAKLAMSMQVLGISTELQADNIAVNALWPRTTIATAAVRNILGGEEMMKHSRTPEIMSDAAHVILCSNAKVNTGNFWIDDEVLVSNGNIICYYVINVNV
jgi:citronellol/citronellal dehydrogenase